MLIHKKILVCVIISLLAFSIKVKTESIEIVKPTFDQEINRIFGEKAEIAKAVFMHESRMKLNAINYNCKYDGKTTFCKKGDRAKAISLDCGIGQINVKGKVCPKELMTEEGQIIAIEKIYKKQGLRAWASFNNKQYLKFL
jgi:hypothetical protein